MPNIFQPTNFQPMNFYSTGEVVTITDDAEEWELPDKNEQKQTLIRTAEFSEEFDDDEELLEESENNYDDEYGSDGDVIPMYIRRQRDSFLQEAREEAQKLVVQAQEQMELDRQKFQEELELILDETKKQAYEEAYEAGLRRGVAQQQNEISQCVRELQDNIAQLAGEQAGFMAEYEQNLKWLALEIASKVLAKKVMEDDSVLLDLVLATMQGVQNAEWVSIEISDKTLKLMDLLQSKLSLVREDKPEVHGIPAPPGTVIVETQDEVIDASISKQLENLRRFFEQLT